MSNANDNRIKQLQEENAQLHKICQRQRDSLAAQQEAIAQINNRLNRTMASLCEKYGLQTDDGSKTLSVNEDSFWSVHERYSVSARREDGVFIITVLPTPREGEAQHEGKTEAGDGNGKV